MIARSAITDESLDEGLVITDIQLLKITRININKVYFTYDGKDYALELLIEPDETTGLIHGRLYSRDRHISWSQNGKLLAETEPYSGFTSLYEVIHDVSKHKMSSLTYYNIDKLHMIRVMEDKGLLVDKTPSSRGYHAKVDKIQSNIEKLQKELNELSLGLLTETDKHLKPTGHGSKCYGKEVKIKASERFIKEAHKIGEVCQKYTDMMYKEVKYGDVDKLTGGVLTDLRSLPYGTYFRCTNGNWIGIIGCDNKGNKTVINEKIIETDGKVITEDNHALYIEVIHR